MPEAPAIVGRYHIERLIAHGGMGSLYLARDPVIDRLVAIKLLREGFDDAAVRERFAREARSAGRLHHPNIVTVFDVGEHHDRPFIAMEYVAGETLAQLIKRRALGRLWQKLAILEDICVGLHYAHGAAIVHRDIKPANVMLDDSGLVKILDFGIARAEGIDITRAGDLVGTLNYMSPEQLAGEGVDHRTDIYSVGVLAYELVTNQMAFPGTIQTGVLHQILNSGPPPITTLVPDIDPDIPVMIQRAMARSPDARYQDLESLRQDLVVVRSRLLETKGEPEEALDPEAETRFYAGGVGSGTQPRSSLRIGSTVASSARGNAVGTAPQPGLPNRRIAPVALAVIAVIFAMAVAAVWIVNRPPAVNPPATSEATAQPEPAQTVPPVAAPPPPAPGSDQAAEGTSERLEGQLRDLVTTARRQIAAGDRRAALDTLRRGIALDATNAEINALIDEQARVARQATTQAGAAAAKRGQRTSAVFQDAQTRERQAESLLRAGDRVPAVEAFWAATSRYNEVPETPVPGQKTSPGPQAPAATAPAIIPAEPTIVPGNPTISTAPPPAPKPLPSPVEKRPASPPEPPPPAAGTKPDAGRELKPEAPREPKADPTAVHLQAIRDTLRRYAEAYQSLDSQAVARVMPSLTQDQLRSLERDFANYRSYAVEIRDEKIAIDATATTATVTCQVARAFVMRNGVGGDHTAASIFHLRRNGSVWTIERLESR